MCSSWWNQVWSGKPKYSEKNLPPCHFVHQNYHMTRPEIEPGPQWQKVGD
jgi:hypothetical protein